MINWTKLASASTLALLLAGPGFAQDEIDPVGTGADPVDVGENAAELSGTVSPDDATRLIRSEDIVDSPIYSLAPEGYEGEWEESEYYEGWYDAEGYDAVGEGWEQIAEVGDIVLSGDGSVVGVIAEVGGFLGLGENQILLDLTELKLVRTGIGGVGAEGGVGVQEGVGGQEGVGVQEGIGAEEGVGAGEGIVTGNLAFVTRYSQEELENLQPIDETWY